MRAVPGRYQICFNFSLPFSPNFYILDEPTNHLDMETIEALAKALNTFRVNLPRGAVFSLSVPSPPNSLRCQDEAAMPEGEGSSNRDVKKAKLWLVRMCFALGWLLWFTRRLHSPDQATPIQCAHTPHESMAFTPCLGV